MANAENQEDQNKNQAAPIDPDKAYSQYIDPDFKEKQKKKKLWLILASSIAALVFIFAVVVIVATLSSGGNDNDSGTSGNTTNIVEECTDEACFNERFSLCQPTEYQVNETEAVAEYKILGIQEVGCLVTLKYISTEEPELSGKEMTCDFDNEIEFKSAMQLAFAHPDDYECEGELKSYLF